MGRSSLIVAMLVSRGPWVTTPCACNALPRAFQGGASVQRTTVRGGGCMVREMKIHRRVRFMFPPTLLSARDMTQGWKLQGRVQLAIEACLYPGGLNCPRVLLLVCTAAAKTVHGECSCLSAAQFCRRVSRVLGRLMRNAQSSDSAGTNARLATSARACTARWRSAGMEHGMCRLALSRVSALSS